MKVADASRIKNLRPTGRSGASRAAMLHAIETAAREGTYRLDPNRIAQLILEEADLVARLRALLPR